MDLFWNLIIAYAAAGAFFSFWYRKEIKVHVDLVFAFFAYDAPEWMNDNQVLAVMSAMYMFIMVLAWPVMITRLEGLR